MRHHRTTALRRVYVALATALWLVIPAVAAAEHAEIFRGQVAFDTNPNGEIVVALDVARGEAGTDGTAEHLFFVQQDPPFSYLTAALPVVEVAFKGRQLVIRSLEGADAWVFFAPEAESGDVADLARAVSGLKDGGYPKVKTVRGFGLSHYAGSFAVEDAAVELAGLLSIPDHFFFDPFQAAGSPFDKPGYDPHEEPAGGGGTGCSAGGSGSTSCSISGCAGSPSSCSASCSANRYSCCKCETTGASCSCYFNRG